MMTPITLTPEMQYVLLAYCAAVVFVAVVMLAAALWRGPGCSGSCKQGRRQCDCKESRDA